MQHQLLCCFRTHYVEYLCGLIYRNNVEPVSVMDVDELKLIFKRAKTFEPKQRPGENELKYITRLTEVSGKPKKFQNGCNEICCCFQVIEKEIPLDTV